MSSPIAIPRRAVSHAAPDYTPSGLYVPLHRRTLSASSSQPEVASSGPASPSVDGTSARVYTPAALLALQTPELSLLMQARIRAACPKVLLTSRAAFLMRQPKAVSNASTHTPAAAAAAATVPTDIIHTPAVPATAPTPAFATQRSAAGPPAPAPAQCMRPTERGPQRRRAALQLADNWRVAGTERRRAAPVPPLVAAF